MKRITFKETVVSLYQYNGETDSYKRVARYNSRTNRDGMRDLWETLSASEYQVITRKETRVFEGFQNVIECYDVFITGHKSMKIPGLFTPEELESAYPAPEPGNDDPEPLFDE